MMDRSRLPPPGLMGGENLWPFSYDEPTTDLVLQPETGLLERGARFNMGGIEEAHEPSKNVDDRRDKKYAPMSLLDLLRAGWRGGHFAYPGRRYGEYDADIDAALQRAEAMYAIDPALRDLARRENWFRILDRPEGPGPEPPERIKREYRRP